MADRTLASTRGGAKLARREETVRRWIARDIPGLGEVGRSVDQLAKRGGFGSTLRRPDALARADAVGRRTLAISWKALSSVLAAVIAGMLVLAAWPRLEPSAMHVKAAVEQPIFVTPLAAIAKRTAPALMAQPIDKSAMSKLATALREQPAAQQAAGQPRRDAGDSDRRGAPALRRRSRRLRQGRHRDRTRVLRQRRGGRRRPRAGRARRHVRSGDPQPSRRPRAQGR